MEEGGCCWRWKDSEFCWVMGSGLGSSMILMEFRNGF